MVANLSQIKASCSGTGAHRVPIEKTKKMLALFLVLLCALPQFSPASGEGFTHSVDKRTTVEQPSTPCEEDNEGDTFFPVGSDSVVWVCKSGRWNTYWESTTIGTKETTPGKSCIQIRKNSCAAITGTYWVNKTDSCANDPPQTIKVYCDMALDGGGWTLVWKHSYMEVATPLTEDMKYFSSFYKPCTDLESGWCNIPQKNSFHPTEMMIVAYHNKSVVYAYKGGYNLNMDKDWYGGILYNPVKIVDTCNSFRGTPPDPSIEHGMGGLAFDKESPGVYTVNCDTYSGSFSYPSDCRFLNCNPGFIKTQMTTAIFVR